MLQISSFRSSRAGCETNCISRWGISPTLVWEMAQTRVEGLLISTLHESDDPSKTRLYNYMQTDVVNLNNQVATASAVHYPQMEAV